MTTMMMITGTMTSPTTEASPSTRSTRLSQLETADHTPTDAIQLHPRLSV
jgi:hypothetical protein